MGRYAEMQPGTIGRWRMVANRIEHRLWLLRQPRHHPDDTGDGYAVHQEFGRWTIRPNSGWRSHRWLTPPIHSARTEDAALNYAAATLI
ncbi:hypothetical protein [Nocardia xishanensis]